MVVVCVAFVVVTAIYALKVSQGILDSFRLVDKGLQTSNGSLKEREDSLFKAAQSHSDENEISTRLKIAREESTRYQSFIDSLKKELINRAGGFDENEAIVKRGDIELAGLLMINEKKGDLLFAKMKILRDTLINVSSDSVARETITKLLTVKAPRGPKGSEKQDISRLTFKHVPVTAAVTILSKFQNDAIAANQAASEGALREMQKK